MSRTSPSQFEVMVEFMERHGDLNKPSDAPHGRINIIHKWEELANILNLDTTGNSKPVEKWKKVWSDFKNNTKRKASKIHRAAGGTGGGPACKLTLTDLEQRVLTIIGTQAVTGLTSIEEVGVEMMYPPEPSAASVGDYLVEVPPPLQMTVQVESIDADFYRPGGSSQSTPFPTEMVDATAASPTPHHAQAGTPTRPRRVIRRRRSTPRRRGGARPTRVDAAAQNFIASDERWQTLISNFATEHLRLREVELQQQAQWQNLFTKCLELIEKIYDK